MISSNSALYFLINDFIQGNVSLKTNVKQMWLGQYWGFPGGAIGKELAYQCRRHKILGFHTWVGKIPWRRAWQPPPVFLSGVSHGQRSLAGYNPWGCKESDMTEVTYHVPTHSQCIDSENIIFQGSFLSS